LDIWAQSRYKAEYIEITVSAYWPNIQRTLSNLGFVPVAYCPSFVFHEVERLDTIKMAKVYIPLNIDKAQLTDESRPIYELVRQGFEEKRLGLLVNETNRRIGIFQGLEEGELAKIAGLCSIESHSVGDIILEAGQKGGRFFIVMEGEINILARDNSTLVGQVHAGDFLGEIALVAQQPYGAKAVAASPVKLGVIKNQDFENLINRYPRSGMNVMRNIAISLGQKLANLDERFYRGVLGSDQLTVNGEQSTVNS
jgi:hypothetical protein